MLASPDGTLAASQIATLAGVQTFTNKTFISPIISTLTVTGGLTVSSGGITVSAGTVDLSAAAVVKLPLVLTASGGALLTLPTATDVLVGRNTTDVLTNKSLTDPSIQAQCYIGAVTQTLPVVTGQSGHWRFYKAWGGALIINSPSANQLVVPGGTGLASTYTSPNGESTGWYCDGSQWWCI